MTTTDALKFAWYACPRTGAFVHFALLSGQQCLAQWALPSPMAVGRPNIPAPGVWLQTAPANHSSEPIAQGDCQVLGEKDAPLAAQALLQAMQRGRLLLHLTGDAGESKMYSLIQLRHGSSAWMLGPASYYCAPAASSLPARKSQLQTPTSL